MAEDTTVPPGTCHCGCGQYTTVATRTRPAFGHVRGQSVRYVNGHRHRWTDLAPPNPSGRCLCGCGQPTRLARETSRRRGVVAGYPNRYLASHQRRSPRSGPAAQP